MILSQAPFCASMSYQINRLKSLQSSQIVVVVFKSERRTGWNLPQPVLCNLLSLQAPANSNQFPHSSCDSRWPRSESCWRALSFPFPQVCVVLYQSALCPSWSNQSWSTPNPSTASGSLVYIINKRWWWAIYHLKLNLPLACSILASPYA